MYSLSWSLDAFQGVHKHNFVGKNCFSERQYITPKYTTNWGITSYGHQSYNSGWWSISKRNIFEKPSICLSRNLMLNHQIFAVCGNSFSAANVTREFSAWLGTTPPLVIRSTAFDSDRVTDFMTDLLAMNPFIISDWLPSLLTTLLKSTWEIGLSTLLIIWPVAKWCGVLSNAADRSSTTWWYAKWRYKRNRRCSDITIAHTTIFGVLRAVRDIRTKAILNDASPPNTSHMQ